MLDYLKFKTKDYQTMLGYKKNHRRAVLATGFYALMSAPLAVAGLPKETAGAIPDVGSRNQPFPIGQTEFDGGPEAYVKGAFGPLFDWPIIPIHVALLPDKRVLSFGTDPSGKTGKPQLVYDVWDPSLGFSASAHITLTDTTPAATNVFCAGQVLIHSTGEILIAAGTVTEGNTTNLPSKDTNFFDYRDNSMVKSQPMNVSRWYPSLVPLTNGEIVVMGGITNASEPQSYVDTPEAYKPGEGWRLLDSAASTEAYGKGNWYYPRAWQDPNGKVLIIKSNGIFSLDTAGTGSINKISNQGVAYAQSILPSAMYAPGKILFVTENQGASIVDVNGAVPTVSSTSALSQLRFYANATVLADGKVAVTGGSAVPNELTSVAYAVETWDPASGQWTLGASAAKPRLYHSTALLLPDATLLTGGGGSPGPVKNLNAEIYYPPYLFERNGSGKLASRPVIRDTDARTRWDRPFHLSMLTLRAVKRLTLLPLGSVTHSWNNTQRFFDLKFTQTGRELTAVTPSSANIALPGYYMLFAFDRNGVPSVAKIVRLG